MMHDLTDTTHSFQLLKAGVRGVIVRLDSAWTDVLEHSDNAPSINRLLGESLAASALFVGALKFEGSLSIHLRGAGTLRLLFAECTHDGYLRGIARCDGDVAGQRADLRDPQARMAITIENSASETRFQGLVPVEADSLAAAFEGYFERSEQLPSRIVLAAREGRCAGIMLQRIARAGGTLEAPDADAWNRVGILLDTLGESELLELPVETLLLRLFHEEDVVLQPARPLAFRCSCSRERVLGMLRSLGPEQAIGAVADTGDVEITCEFCNRTYKVDRIDVAGLFAGQPLAPGSAKPQ